jgi:hypothetical protein
VTIILNYYIMEKKGKIIIKCASMLNPDWLALLMRFGSEEISYEQFLNYATDGKTESMSKQYISLPFQWVKNSQAIACVSPICIGDDSMARKIEFFKENERPVGLIIMVEIDNIHSIHPADINSQIEYENQGGRFSNPRDLKLKNIRQNMPPKDSVVKMNEPEMIKEMAYILNTPGTYYSEILIRPELEQVNGVILSKHTTIDEMPKDAITGLSKLKQMEGCKKSEIGIYSYDKENGKYKMIEIASPDGSFRRPPIVASLSSDATLNKTINEHIRNSLELTRNTKDITK